MGNCCCQELPLRPRDAWLWTDHIVFIEKDWRKLPCPEFALYYTKDPMRLKFTEVHDELNWKFRFLGMTADDEWQLSRAQHALRAIVTAQKSCAYEARTRYYSGCVAMMGDDVVFAALAPTHNTWKGSKYVLVLDVSNFQGRTTTRDLHPVDGKQQPCEAARAAAQTEREALIRAAPSS